MTFFYETNGQNMRQYVSSLCRYFDLRYLCRRTDTTILMTGYYVMCVYVCILNNNIDIR